VKDPGSPYRPSARVDTWIKVKPEYMKEFGEVIPLSQYN
jgi:ATP-dependent DNA ligase